MEQKQKDYEVIQIIWHVFRDYSDLPEMGEYGDRYSEMYGMMDDTAKEYPEFRKVLSEVVNVFNDRIRKRRIEIEQRRTD